MANKKYKPRYKKQLEDYIQRTTIPYLEEACLEVYNTDLSTFNSWRKTNTGFDKTVGKLLMKQKAALLKLSLSKNVAQASAIFQLKANHGMVEKQYEQDNSKMRGWNTDNQSLDDAIDLLQTELIANKLKKSAEKAKRARAPKEDHND